MNGTEQSVARTLTAVSSNATALSRVVELNERAKSVLGDSHQIDLRAFDAIVRSIHAGPRLRGFATVSQQMRGWSRELQAAVLELKQLTARRVELVSRSVKERRLASFLAAAAQTVEARAALADVTVRAEEEVAAAADELKRNRRLVRSVLEDLRQLGLMACVLSTAAQLEATAGSADQFRDLTVVSKDFAERSERVNETIRAMLARDQEAVS
jgi:hypothetical protein